MIDFKTLIALSEEGEMNLRELIAFLALDDVPMTDAVLKLGMAYGILTEDYHNNWSEERPDF